MEKTVTITTIILVAWAIILIVLERLYPYRKGLPIFREGFWVDLIWYTFIQSYFLQIVIFSYIILPIDNKFHLSALHIITNWPIVVQILFFLVTHDFYIYWFHRLQHSSKILWRTHEAHHSNTSVDWLSGSRSHATEILINQSIEFLPIVLLGANPIVVPIKALIDAVWGMYIHSNLNVKSGKLQYFINGPEMHLWHHADNRVVFFANYATKFALWDWLFGTAYHPGMKPVKYGLYYDYPRDFFLQQLFLIFRIDEQKMVRNSKLFRAYYNSRPALVNYIKRIFAKEKREQTGEIRKAG